MTGPLKALAVAVGVIGAVVIAIGMLLGPLSSEPPPGTIERFVIFAYPICMLLAGVFVVLRTRIALLYSVLAIVFAATFVVIHLSGTHDWDTLGAKVVFAMLLAGPALIMTSLCWSVRCSETGRVIPTRLG